MSDQQEEEKKDYCLKICGSPYNGCLFLPPSAPDLSTPTSHPSPLQFTNIAAGPKHCIGLTEDSSLYLWGEHLISPYQKEQVHLSPLKIALAL